MKADLTSPGYITFTAEEGETDASNAAAITQAVLELSVPEPEYGPESVAWVDEFVIAALMQPRHRLLLTPCLTVERLKDKRLNLCLEYGKAGELLLLTDHLTTTRGGLPFMTIRASDMAICTRETFGGRHVADLFQGGILSQRLACYSIFPKEGETDWLFRRRAAYIMLTENWPAAVPAIEYLLGCPFSEMTTQDYMRRELLGMLIISSAAEEVETVVKAFFTEYEEDPMVTRYRARSSK